MYRSRFEKGLADKSASFISSLSEDDRIFDQDIVATMAHDIMLHEQGILKIQELKAILRALQDIRARGKLDGQRFEDVHELLESEVISAIGLATGGRMHTARSRNDQVNVAIRMRIRADILDLCAAILGLSREMLRLAGRYASRIMPLYTHTQRAQVGTLGHYFLAQVDLISRDFERLMQSYARVNLNPLGACAIGGTSFPIDRRRTSALLGFQGLVENSIDAVSSRDFAIEVVAGIANLMANLSRMSEDLILWSSQEFNFLEIGDEYASPSSVMPQKKNPCTLELIRARTGRAYGSLLSMLAQVKGLPTGYNRDLQDLKPQIWNGFDVAMASVLVLTGVLSSLKVNGRALEEASRQGFLTAVDLAEEIVQRYGLSFREAHRVVGALVRRCHTTGRGLSDLRAEEVKELSASAIGREVGLSKNFLRKALDPHRCLLRRRSTGSPNPSEIRGMLRSRKGHLEGEELILNERLAALRSSERLMAHTVKRYMGEGTARR
jgi:argininosuccinate lyase